VHALQYIELSLKKGLSLDTIKSNAALRNLLSDPRFRPSSK
jgi:hypothetical protein